MIRACCKPLTALACAALLLFPRPASAAFMADPDALYNSMKSAYENGAAHGWTFYNRQYYLATIFDAGRAYALQRADDPSFKQIEELTVDVASELHYDPLINHEAVEWYVREAATDVARSGDPVRAAKAQTLIAHVDALEDPALMARVADADASANLERFPRDGAALLQRVEANWRGYSITHDLSWRDLAFVRAAQIDFPIGSLPLTWGPQFLEAVKAAAAGSGAYSRTERDNAQVILQHLGKSSPLKTISSVTAVPSHDRLMTTLAPADEYFGPLGMSILGIRNEMNRVNYMAGYGYGRQESAQAVQIAVAIDDLHKVYPRDRDVPQLLLDGMNMLAKIDTAEAKAARSHLHAVLTIEYQDSRQAQGLLNSD